MPLKVTTPLLRWLGCGSIAAALAGSFVVSDGWLGIVLCWGIFGSLGASLILMSATIAATADAISVRRAFSTVQVRWAEVTAASTGGGNLVLYFPRGRVSMPSTEFWYGADRDKLVSMVLRELGPIGSKIRPTVRAALHADGRQPDASPERTREP